MSNLKCPKCGSNKLTKQGRVWLAGQKVQQYLCNGCGKRTAHPKEETK